MENKCHFKVLSETKNGSITRCAKCGDIHMIYRNIVTRFSLKNFISFIRSIASIDPQEFTGNFFNDRNIHIQSGISNIVFVFSEDEINELKLLLNQAEILIETEKILTP